MNNDSVEVNTTLVNYTKSRTYGILSWVFAIILVVAGALGGVRSNGGFLSLSENPFIKDNLSTLRIVAAVTLYVSIFLVGLSIIKQSQFDDSGFIKMNLHRVNVKGLIFRWSEITSLKFIINSPSVFGERSAKDGYRNWIEFVANGTMQKYEFYLKTQRMEDNMLNLIQQIKAGDGAPKLSVINTRNTK